MAGKSRAWSEATQKRVAITSSMLSSVKSLKMMGLSNTIESKIQNRRAEEIRAAKDFRWLIVWFNVAANSVMIFGPVVTFTVYSLVALWEGKASLSTNKAFTSLALISIVTGNASQLLAVAPLVASASASFDRIQKFLLDPSREDKRLGKPELVLVSNRLKYDDNNDEELVQGTGNGNGLQESSTPEESNIAISVEGATIRPAKTAEPALIDFSIEIKKSSICLIAGPVGCGKTTLARAILGELPTDSGEIETSSKRIGYCAQSAWLLNGTIKENICGPIFESEIDEKWYRSTIHACGLERDFSLLADGDKSLIGSRGLVLSGGQKQRVALARAVYARAKVVLLDDVLSALDAKTERFVVDKLIGSEGLFRKHGTTVILITHSRNYFHLADHIVVIGTDKKVAEQGTFERLRSQEGYISKLLVQEDHDNHTEEEEHKITRGKTTKRDPNEDNAADLTRKTGDTAVYGESQYDTTNQRLTIPRLLASLRWLVSRSDLPRHQCWLWLLHHSPPIMVEMVDRGLLRWSYPLLPLWILSASIRNFILQLSRNRSHEPRNRAANIQSLAPNSPPYRHASPSSILHPNRHRSHSQQIQSRHDHG